MALKHIPDRMRAIQVIDFNEPYQINTVPVPKTLGPHDLLVKVGVASNCHTDSMVHHGVFGVKPVIASHEGAGTVVAAGSSVNDFKVGDRVMCGLPFHPCGECGNCTGPEYQKIYCENIVGHSGVTRDGFFAEYALVDSRTSTPLPDEITLQSAAPLACAGRTIWRAVLEAELERGQWIALVGSGGGLGHLGIQFAKNLGLKVIGVDARDEGIELSQEAGADVVVDARKGIEQCVKDIKQATGQEGVDAAVTISDADNAAALACAITKMHGTAVQVAQPEKVSIPFAEFIFRDIRVKGSLLCSPEQSKDMVQSIAKHGVKVKTNPFSGLDSIEELGKLVHGGKIKGKAIIIVDEEQIQREKELGAKY